MDFGNIHLHHETVEQAARELRAAGSLMETNLHELMQRLTNVIDGGHFQGVAAVAFHELSRVVAANDDQMKGDIDSAATTLERMHETMIQGDHDAGKKIAH